MSEVAKEEIEKGATYVHTKGTLYIVLDMFKVKKSNLIKYVKKGYTKPILVRTEVKFREDFKLYIEG